MILLEVSSIFSNTLPLPCDIEKVDPESRYGKSVRKSANFAIATAIGLGFAGTLITQTPWPFLGASAIGAFMYYQYHIAINFDPEGVY
jgi:hypothetical protein